MSEELPRFPHDGWTDRPDRARATDRVNQIAERAEIERMIGAPRVWDRKLWALRFDPPQTKAHAEDDSDDRDLRQKVFSRGLAVIAVAMGFTLALLGLYAEIAVTSLVCSRLGLRHGAEFVHAAAGVLYFVAVVIAARLAYAGTLE